VIGRTIRDNSFWMFFQKLRVWCSSPNAKWELGQIQSISGDDAEILLANGKVSVLYCHGDIFGETPVQFLLNVYLLRL
jgi:hypothetical protein